MLQPMGSQRVGHDKAAELSISLKMNPYVDINIPITFSFMLLIAIPVSSQN